MLFNDIWRLRKPKKLLVIKINGNTYQNEGKVFKSLKMLKKLILGQLTFWFKSYTLSSKF